jgi:hypothetical protein
VKKQSGVGCEPFNRDPNGDGRRLWEQGHSRNAQIPSDAAQVLFIGNPIDHQGRQGLAEAVYLETPAGAKVFNAGSTRWVWGLGKPGFESESFKKFNENLVLHMLR